MYIIDNQPDAVCPDNSRALIRDSHGVLIAATYHETAEETARIIVAALSNPDLFSAIQAQSAELAQLRPAAERVTRLEAQLQTAGETQRRQTAESLRLHGLLAERNNTIARLQSGLAAKEAECNHLADGLADLRSRIAESEALNSYVLDGGDAEYPPFKPTTETVAPALWRCACGREFTAPTRCGDCDTNAYRVEAAQCSTN